MTEREWWASPDPLALLKFVAGRASARKLRLFAAACCRHIEYRLTSEHHRHAIAIAEEFADGLRTADELLGAFAAAWKAHSNYDCAAWATVMATASPHLDGLKTAWATAVACAAAESHRPKELNLWLDSYCAWEVAYAESRGRNEGIRWRAIMHGFGEALEHQNPEVRESYRFQAGLLRDLIGNPFCSSRPAVDLSAGAAELPTRLAQTIYDERSFAEMPILADALEEAGYTDAELLRHFRSPETHVLGCWALDLVAGKE